MHAFLASGLPLRIAGENAMIDSGYAFDPATRRGSFLQLAASRTPWPLVQASAAVGDLVATEPLPLAAAAVVYRPRPSAAALGAPFTLCGRLVLVG